LVNNCDMPLLRADFRFVPGARVTWPHDGSTYNGPSGCSYVVNLVGGPNGGIAFLPPDDHPIQGGQAERYHFTAMREDLSSDTVLWGSAETTDGTFGRFDIRAGYVLLDAEPEGDVQLHGLRSATGASHRGLGRGALDDLRTAAR
jgi:hypothetical protein